MLNCRTISFMTITGLAISSGGAHAQSKVTPAQMFFDGAYEAAVPAEGATTTLPLGNLKIAHAAWMTFVNYTGSKPVQDAQVISLMEGVAVKWAGGKESCVYELRLTAAPAAITLTKQPGMCALKPPGNMVFKVLAL